MRPVAVLAVPLLIAGLVGAPGSLQAAVGAVPVATEFAFEDARVLGDLRLQADRGALLLAGAPGLVLEAARVDVQVVRVTKDAVANPLGRPVTVVREQGTDRWTLADARAEAFGGPEGGWFYAYVDAGTPGPGRFDLPLGAVAGRPFRVAGQDHHVLVGDAGQRYALAHTVAAPAFGVGTGDLPGPFAAPLRTVTLTGSFRLVVDFATLALDATGTSRVVETGRWEQPAATAAGLAPVASINRTFAVLDVQDGVLRADVEPDRASARFLTDAPTYALQGELWATGARGGGLANGTRASIQGDVELAGDLTIAPRATRREAGLLGLSGGAWAVDAAVAGEADRFLVNQRSVLPAPPADAVRAASLLAMVAGLLLAAWGTLQKVGAPFLLPLYARLLGKEVLNNEHRLAIFELVRDRPLIHLRELQRESGFGYGTVAYHTTILKQQRLLASVRTGREEVYFHPRAGFPAAAMRSLAMIANPARRRIAEVVAREGPVSQERLAAKLGVSRGFLSRQLARLERGGLVVVEGRRNKAYRATPLLLDWLARGEGRGLLPRAARAPAS